MALIIFYLCIVFLLMLFSYPLIACAKAGLYGKKYHKTKEEYHPVSIIIACSNEELYIKNKIDSFLDKDEWIEGSEIIVISNNSTDSTPAILQDYHQHPQVRVFIEKGPSSKIKSVNKGVLLSTNDILVFSDCRQKMKKGSVKKLIQHLNDPGVGTVNSTLLNEFGSNKFNLRKILNHISDCESQHDSSLNVFGALYAQRKSVFREIPEDLLFDDLFVTVSTLLQQKRLVSEKEAVIYDIPFDSYYKKNRLQRLARGLLIFLFNHHGLIRQLPAGLRWRFYLFKYFKLLLPFVLMILFVDTFFVLPVNSLFLLYTLLFAFALMLSLLPVSRKPFFHFFTINYHFLIATIQFLLFNKRSNKWDELSKINKN